MRAVIAVIALSFASTTAAHACAMRMPENLSLEIAMDELDEEPTEADAEADVPVADAEAAPEGVQLVEVEAETDAETVSVEDVAAEVETAGLLEGLEALADAATEEPKG